MEKESIDSVIKEMIRSVEKVADDDNIEERPVISDILKNFSKENREIKKEFKNNLKKIFNNNLNKGNNSTIEIIKEVKNFLSNKNYNKLTGTIQKKDLLFIEDYNKQLKDKALKLKKEYRKNRIKSPIKKDAEYTILTNGTTDISNTKDDNLQIKLAKHYYLTENEILNSDDASKEYAFILNSKNSIFFDWKGDNILKSVKADKVTMSTKAKEISDEILKIDPPSINLIGHSHGGNIMVLVTNLLHDKGYDVVNKVFNLITLSTPVRADIQFKKELEGEINHTEFFSKKDFVQNTGFIDNADYGGVLTLSLLTSFFGLIPMLCGAFGLHNFKYAKNRIEITNYIEKAADSNNVDYIFKKVNDLLKNMFNEKSAFKYHQATRSVRLFKNLLIENNLLEN